MNNQKGIAPIIIALIVALLLGVGGYAVVKQRENKKAEVKLISTDIFKNATYRIAFSTGKVRGIPTEFTMTGGFSSNSIKDFPLCNISGLGIKNELAIATIDQGQARGVVAIDCSYGASFIDVFLVAFKNLNGVPVQTDAVDLRLHPDLSSRNLSQVGVKQIALDANGVLTVTVLVIPDALRNAPTVQQSASESVTISYSLDNQGKLTPTPTSITVTSNWKTYEDSTAGFSIGYPASWTYQKLDCNVAVVAFCLSTPGINGCGQTCAENLGISPIYLNKYSGNPAISQTDNLKYWADANVSLELKDVANRDIYAKMISTFKFTTPSTTATSDWKTYTNGKYGFEIKYPKDYAVSENGISQANGPAYKFESINISSLDEKVGFILHIDVSSDPNILVGPDDRENKEAKVINGIKFTGFSDPGMGDRFGYTTKYGNYYYRLDAVFDTGLFDKILSTFKFTK